MISSSRPKKATIIAVSALVFSSLSSVSAVAQQITATGTNASICDQEVSTNVGVTAERLANGDCLIQFKSTSAAYTWTPPSKLNVVRVLVVGGGGGGGAAKDNGSGGGGGAGQVKELSALTIPTGNTLSISIGSGGIAGIGAATYPNEAHAGAGQNSTLSVGGNSLVTALGGNPGGGSRIATPGAANSIPSGGIGGTAATSTVASQGGSRGSYLGGGGGGGGSFGNGGTGAAGSSGAGGTGGSGTTSVILDSSLVTTTIFGTGGAGGVPSTTLNGTSASANTGNGGKGAGAGATIGADGGVGGSGIVVIRYAPTPITINSLQISGGGNTATYRTSVNLVANVEAQAKVTFYSNGKRIAGCINLATSGTSPNITATCAWKAASRGSQSITAQAVPASPQFTGTTNSPLQLVVQNRSGSR